MHIATGRRDQRAVDLVLRAASWTYEPHLEPPSNFFADTIALHVVRGQTPCEGLPCRHHRHRRIAAPRIATLPGIGHIPFKQGEDSRLIAFEQAAYGFGGRDLVSDVTLSLAPGSFHFLTGPSGAGKTSFLRLCHGELLPSAGRVTLFGADTADTDRDGVAALRRRVGMVHQNVGFLDHLTVTENVALPVTVTGRTADPEDLEQLLAWVGLGGRRDAMPPELSGGERQRAALARALLPTPEVILADEPTGNVDWEMSQRLLHLLVELNRMGRTVLIATHDMNLIRAAKGQVQARVLRIAGGTVQSAGADL